jgi:hypothetical protein
VIDIQQELRRAVPSSTHVAAHFSARSGLAEVAELQHRLAVRPKPIEKKKILRFHVAVHEAGCVYGGEPREELSHNPPHLRLCETASLTGTKAPIQV